MTICQHIEQIINPAPDDAHGCIDCEVNIPAPVPVPDPEPTIHKQRYLWFLDAGHGKLSLGKRSPLLGSSVTIIDKQDRLFEWQFNMDIRLRIEEQLESLGVAYAATMPDHGNYGNELKRRASVANNHPSALPKLGVSIHGNAGPARSVNHYTDDRANGVETWHYSKSVRGKKMAGIFQQFLLNELREYRVTNRGLRHKLKGEFYILKATKMPFILTENLFFNNRKDLALMLREEVRQAIADAHVSAILHIEEHGLTIAHKALINE